MFKNLFTKKRQAESLIEVMIAMFVLSIASIGALALLAASRGANENIENRTIALNLAREGVEAMRTIRDSNWQHCAGDGNGNFWDYRDTTLTNCNTVEPTSSLNKVQNGSYIAYYDDDFNWTADKISDSVAGIVTDNVLTPASAFCAAGTEGAHCQYALRKFTCQVETDSVDNNLYKDYGLYNHKNSGFDATKVLACGGGIVVKTDGYGTDFFREIIVKNKTTTSFDVAVRIYWIEKGQVKDVSLETSLTNYLPVLRDSNNPKVIY